MGIAIILVVIRHTRDFLTTDQYLNTFLGLGYCGVDFFFLLSGFGLFLGYKEQDTTYSFWKRRLKRIMPTYVIVNLLYYLLIGKYNPFLILFSISGIGFFCNKHFLEWYIPSLFAFYFIFPYLMRTVRRYNPKFVVMGGVTIGLLLELILIFLQKPVMQHLFLSRIPIFFVGVLCGVLYKQSTSYKVPGVTLAIISFVVLVLEYSLQLHLSNDVLWTNGLFWLPFILIIPGMIIICVWLFERIGNTLNRIFENIGKVSLEMYLLHISVLNIYRNALDQMYSENYGSSIAVFYTILFIVCIYCCSVILQRATNYIIKVLR